MKKIIFSIITLFLISNAYADGIEDFKDLKDIKSNKDFYLFQTYYYTNPKPNLVVSSINYIISNKLSDNPNNLRHFIPFYAEVFNANDKYIPLWFKKVNKLSDNDRFVFIQSLVWNHTTNSKNQAKLFLTQTNNQKYKDVFIKLIESGSAIDLRTGNISNGEQLDMIWSSFFATGEDIFVKRIIELTPTNDNSINEIGIYSAAKWSLKSNSRNHEKVYSICKEYLQTSNGEIKKFLESFIK